MGIIEEFLALFRDSSTDKAKELIEENIAKVEDAIDQAAAVIGEEPEAELEDEPPTQSQMPGGSTGSNGPS
jgi:hypothetical protein